MEKRKKGTDSPALLSAQKKLDRLRRLHQQNSDSHPDPVPGRHGRSPHPRPIENDNQPLFTIHLGWGSDPLTHALETAGSHIAKERESEVYQIPINQPRQQQNPPARAAAKPLPENPFLKLYPAIAFAMLRHEAVSAGRIWLLLHYVDSQGCGWVDLSTARKRLAGNDADLRVCGRRQFRKLMDKGEGLFWRRCNKRIWLRSVSKVAASLGVDRLTGDPVALPINALLQGIGHARAHLYASFHSSRNQGTENIKEANPIARTTLQRMCHASRRTQQRYERRVGIRLRANLALGRISTIENDQRCAWKQGNAAFRFTDYKGTIGRKGVTYSAWQLPNNYHGPHATLPRGRQRKINRELADLFMKGMTGNGKDLVTSGHLGDGVTPFRDECLMRLYYENALSAAVIYTRSPRQDAYWPDRQHKLKSYRAWFLFSGEEDV